MEKRDYRDNLERISKRFSGELISLPEVVGYLGCDKRTLIADKTFPSKKVGGRYFVTAVALAKWLS
jgi:chromosome condensin MukBEF MukE localization factor